MAADAGLIRASFEHGKSLAGAAVPDTSAFSKSAVSVGRTFFGAAKDIVKMTVEKRRKNRGDKTKRLQGFKTKLDSARQKLRNVNLDLPPQIQESLITKFKDLENRFIGVNTVGKKDNEDNEKARARLEYELDSIIAKQTELRTLLTTQAELGANNINIDATKANALAIGEKLYDFDGWGDDVKVGFTDKHEMFFAITLRDHVQKGSDFIGDYDENGNPIIGDWEMEPADYTEYWSMEEIKNSIVFKNIDIDTGENTRYTALEKKGKQTDDDWMAHEGVERSDITNNVLQNDRNRTYDASVRGISGQPAWKDHLTENPNILIESLPGVPQEMIDLLDVDGGGSINFEDLEKLSVADKVIWQHNLEQIVDALVEPDSDFYNFDVTTELLTEYLLDRRKQSFDAGRVIRNKEKDEVTSDLTYAQRLKSAQQKDLYPRVQEAITTGDYSNVNLLGGNKKVTPSSKDPNKLNVFEGTSVIDVIDTTKPGWEQQIMNFFMEDPLYKYQIPGGGKILD